MLSKDHKAEAKVGSIFDQQDCQSVNPSMDLWPTYHTLNFECECVVVCVCVCVWLHACRPAYMCVCQSVNQSYKFETQTSPVKTETRVSDEGPSVKFVWLNHWLTPQRPGL